MGSSKKRKEEKRSRSRSGSRTAEKSGRKRRHRGEDEKGPSREKKSRRHENEAEEKDDTGGGGELSMSVEETNKLRAQLGLAPLDNSDQPTVREVESADGTSTDKVVSVDGKEFVHKPAENLGAKKAEISIREKLQAAKEKRQIHDKLSKVKTIAESAQAESASSWVERMRKLDDEKKLADQRAKMLEEMDKEFGVGALVAEETKKKRPTKKATGYNTKDLAGMKVLHSKEAFVEGRETVLVLQDKDVLNEEDDDVLINPTLAEEEQWKKNADLRKKKPGYNPYDEEMDEYGMPKRSLLSKYDEEIEGEKKDAFTLDAKGEADTSEERMLAAMRSRMHEGAETLDLEPPKLASEYYTSDELTTFKKPKKKVKKLRKRTGAILKADDLVADAPVKDEDFGSRARGRGRRKAEYERETATTSKREIKQESEDEIDNVDDSYEPAFDDEINIHIEDEAEQELQSILAKTRMMQQMEVQKKLGAEKVVELLPKSEEMEEDAAINGNNIVMDSISEYCRGLGDIPTYGLAGNREDVDEDDLIDVERGRGETSKKYEEEMEEEEDEREEDKGGWHERDFDDKDRPKSRSSSSSSEGVDHRREPILEEEYDVSVGVGAALKLAVQKGYLKQDGTKTGGNERLDHLRSQRFTVMDKQFHDIDDKYAKKLERMGGSGGPIVDFKDKPDYKPNVRLEYADEKGRLMDEKDAFRYLSWKFHGKMPGKRKIEKRAKKVAEKELMNEMSSTDTPLGTLSKQLEKQRQLQVPYIVLSGSGSRDVGTSIKKD